jgi:hypothetical protein
MKPIVDGLEQNLGPELGVVRLDLLSRVGRAAAREYGIWAIPATVLFDRQGQVVNRQMGLLNPAEIVAQLQPKP